MCGKLMIVVQAEKEFHKLGPWRKKAYQKPRIFWIVESEHLGGGVVRKKILLTIWLWWREMERVPCWWILISKSSRD